MRSSGTTSPTASMLFGMGWRHSNTSSRPTDMPTAGSTFRHGRVFGAPMGEPPYGYYAEWEWPDMDAFKSAARSDEFMATGKDAMAMGGKFSVMFADVD